MNITFFGNGKFELKTKTGTITTGEVTKINDYVIPGSGEYEVAEIQTEVIDEITSIHAEELNIVYLDNRKKILSDKEVERVNGADILFVPVGGGPVFDPKQALEAINQIEPKIVIPMHFEDAGEFIKIVGGTPETLETLKITKSQINDEQKKVVILRAC